MLDRHFEVAEDSPKCPHDAVVRAQDQAVQAHYCGRLGLAPDRRPVLVAVFFIQKVGDAAELFGRLL